jgi:hypothetical protein
MQALADALEARGEYRQASLLYRDLLRPAEFQEAGQSCGAS